MKKLFLSLFLIPLFGITQEMPSPNQAGLVHLQNVPVNQYNGVASVSVPLGNAGPVPISLQYNTGGIKVNEEASSVGLGWNLIAGGSISRVMRGEPDEVAEWNSSTANADLKKRVKNSGFLDGEKDLFFFTTPSGSGKFIMGTGFNGICQSFQQLEDSCLVVIKNEYPGFSDEIQRGLAKEMAKDNRLKSNLPCQGGEAVLDDFTFLPYANTRLEFIYTDRRRSYWVMTDEAGVKYYFGSNQNGTNYDTEYIEVTSVNSANLGDAYKTKERRTYISTWHLSRIEYPNLPANKAVTFVYGDKKYISEESYSYLDRYSATQWSWNLHRERTYKSKREVYSRYLKKILFENGSAVFTNASRVDSDATRLSEIKLYDLSNTLVTSITFNQDYFVSSDSYYMGSTRGYVTQKLSHRLRLNSVSIDGHVVRSFDYANNKEFDGGIDIYELPPRDSFYYDHWGYYNGGQHHGTVYDNTAKVNGIQTSNGIKNVPGMDRSPYISAKANMLTEVIFPTGGKTKLYYSLNSASGTNMGGLRVDKIENLDENGQIVSAMSYEYFLPVVDDLPVYYVEAPKEGEFYDIVDVSKTNIMDLNGLVNGYQKVITTDLNTGATVENWYISPLDSRPISPRKKSKFNYDVDDDQIDKNNVSTQLGPPYISNSLYFHDYGSPKEVYQRDNTGKLLSRTITNYELPNIEADSVSNLSIMKADEDNDGGDWDIYFYAGEYTISTRPVRVSSTVQKVYEDGQELITSTIYDYQSALKTVPKSITTTHPDGSKTSQTISYVIDAPSGATPAIEFMKQRNMMGVPVWQSKLFQFPHEVVSYTGSLHGVTYSKYQLFNQGTIDAFVNQTESFGLLLKEPASLGYFTEPTYAGGEPQFNVPMESNARALYDNQGRLTQQINKDGITKSYTYDAKGYVTATTTSTGVHSRSSNYQYKELVGITEVVDANGDKINYEFDSRNRLHLVRDKDGNIIKRYRYHSVSDDEIFNGNPITFVGLNKTGHTLSFSSGNAATYYGETTYSWDFDDNQTDESTTAQISHAYGSAGTYQLQLTMQNPEYQLPVVVSRTVSVYDFEAPLTIFGQQTYNSCDSGGGIEQPDIQPESGSPDHFYFFLNQGGEGAICYGTPLSNISWEYRVDGGAWNNLFITEPMAAISKYTFSCANCVIEIRATANIGCDQGLRSAIHTLNVVYDCGSGGGSGGGGGAPSGPDEFDPLSGGTQQQ